MPTSVLDHKFGSDHRSDAVAYGLCDLPVIDPTDVRVGNRATGGRLECSVVVSPGTVQLTYRRAQGWKRDALDPVEVARLSKRLQERLRQLDRLDVRLFMEQGQGFGEWDYFAERAAVLEQVDELRELLGLTRGKTRSRCGEWSRKSRARCTRRMATLDYTPWEIARTIQRKHVAMVTFTYPGDYLAVCPTGETGKRHLHTFRVAFEREYGPAHAVWKLERQRRGAPHFHVVMPMWPTHTKAGRDQRDWCRRTWARIVGATGEDRTKHELAGVSVDFHEGSRMTDPQRIAVYFSKHNSQAADSPKAYQNVAPDGWLDPEDGGGVGRWWGYWRLRPLEVSARVGELDALQVQRLLRAWVEAQQRTHVKRVDRLVAKGRHIDHLTGEIRSGKLQRRAVTRRYRVRSLSGCKPAGFVLSNDAPSLIRQIGRALADPPDWTPGERRPLP